VFFTRCTSGSPYVVEVPGSYNVSTLSANVEGADISFRGTAGTSAIVGNGAWGTPAGFSVAARETVTFDGVAFSTPDYIRTAAGTTLRVLNGGSLLSNREMWIEGADSVVEARGGSTVGTIGWGVDLYGPRARIIVDDSTLQATGNSVYLAGHDGAVDNVVEFHGDHPRLVARGIAAGTSVTDASSVNVPTLLFFVPENGYAEAPVQRTSNENNVLNGANALDIKVEIARESPLFRTGRVRDVPLVAWNLGILADAIDTGDQPRPRNTRIYWTYGAGASTTPDGNNPTGLRASLVGNGSTVLFLR